MGKVAIREDQILEELKIRGQLSLKELTEMFLISESTARRMCAELERNQRAIRTFGGIRQLPEVQDPEKRYLFNEKETEHQKEKTDIGRYAASLVEKGDVIFLTGGTTVQRMADELVKRIKNGNLSNILILTNSIACAEMLAEFCPVTLTGGRIRLERRDVAGFMSEETVRKARFDKAFVGVDGIDLKEGLMAHDMDTSNLDRVVAGQSDRVYILADSSKFHKPYLSAYEHVLQKHIILTDNGVDEQTVAYAEDNQIAMVIVDKNDRFSQNND